MARAVRKNEEGLEGYAEGMACHLGDFTEYAALRHEIARLEKDGARVRSASRRAEAAVSLETLKIGDVIKIPSGRRAGYAVVVHPSKSYRGETPAPTVVTEDKQLLKLTLVDVPTPVEPIAHVKVPPHFNAKSPKARRDLATSLRIAVPYDPPPGRSRGTAAYAGSAEDERISRAAPPAQGPPVPPVPGPRGPRPLGGALVAAQARDRRAAAQGGGAHQLGGADLRPDLHAARRDGLPVRQR